MGNTMTKFIAQNYEWFVNFWVPILTALIAFGGLLVTAIVTVKQNHKNRMNEIDQKKSESERMRILQASRIIGESRLQWIKEVREVLSEYAGLHESVLFELNKFANNPGKHDIYEKISPLVGKLNSKEYHLLSFFNPIVENNEKDNKIKSLIEKSRPKIHQLTREILDSKKDVKNLKWKQTYKECENKKNDVLFEVRNYLKVEWEKTKESLINQD